VNFTSFTGLSELLKMLPYIVTIMILVINSAPNAQKGESTASFLGVSYFREER
jgi:simple sugar transport system permease protein